MGFISSTDLNDLKNYNYRNFSLYVLAFDRAIIWEQYIAVTGELHPASSRKRPLVKQADVILLGFPLDMDMSLDLRKNDLEIYERVVFSFVDVISV